MLIALLLISHEPTAGGERRGWILETSQQPLNVSCRGAASFRVWGLGFRVLGSCAQRPLRARDDPDVRQSSRARKASTSSPE